MQEGHKHLAVLEDLTEKAEKMSGACRSCNMDADRMTARCAPQARRKSQGVCSRSACSRRCLDKSRELMRFMNDARVTFTRR